MLRIKLFAAFTVLGLVGIVLSNSPLFVSKAGADDILREIAKYKTWQKVNKKPIETIVSFPARPIQVSSLGVAV